MNDGERDAWLREALRHAPDSDALPPSGVSEAILLKARAAARAAAPAGRRAASREPHANPLTAFWNWLARPPVAAGFASVMAASLVGLMWWDRPMDEGMPRPPAMANERAPAALAPAPASASAPEEISPATPAPAPAAAPLAPLTESTPATAPTPESRSMNAAGNAAAPDGAVARPQGSVPEQAGSADARRAEPAAAPARRSADLLAKEGALSAETKSEGPAPFPSAEMQREMSSPRKSLDGGAANDAKKKDADASRARAVDEVERAAEPPATRPVAPATAVRPPFVGATEPAPEAPSASGRPDTPQFQQRQSPAAGLREKEAPGVAAPAPAPFRVEPERAGSESRIRADASLPTIAPTRLLAAIAAEPERWLRQTAGGDTVALDPGWCAWLAELDAAAAGRWEPLGVAAPPADGAAPRDASTTLRLVSGGRVAAIVRVDGTSAQVDAAPGSGGERWQATLAPGGAERLRSTARRLSP